MDPVLQSNPKIDIILRRVRDIPTLPTMVDRILEKLNQQSASAAEIAKLISYDAGLTSKFLRMVNSAAYGFQRQISSIQHAIMILGFGQVRGIVVSTSIVKMFANKAPGGLDVAEFWQHSLQTGMIARTLAEKFKIPYAEDAFSAGILHDIGKITLDAYFGPDYGKVLTAAEKKGMPAHGEDFVALEHEILEFDHTEIGHCLALRWRLPLTFKDVIRYHHTPSQAQDAPALVYMVALANAFSHLMLFNNGTLEPTWIPQDVLTYFNYTPETPESLTALFDLACEQMLHVEELMTVIKS